MVFEVIDAMEISSTVRNPKGQTAWPDTKELESGRFNELWENQLQAVNRFAEDEIDSFPLLVEGKIAGTRQF